jgi:hypothetical protein
MASVFLEKGNIKLFERRFISLKHVLPLSDLKESRTVFKKYCRKLTF